MEKIGGTSQRSSGKIIRCEVQKYIEDDEKGIFLKINTDKSIQFEEKEEDMER